MMGLSSSSLSHRLAPALAVLILIAGVLSGPALHPARAQDSGTAMTAASPATGSAAGRAEASYQFTLAKMLMDEGDYRAARDAFVQALTLDPDAVYVRIEYSEFLSRLGRFGRTATSRVERLREAVDQADQAVDAQPDNPDALRAKASANMALAAEAPGVGEPMAAAIQALEAVRAQDPYDVRSLLSLGQIYLRRGDAQKAADVFETVVDNTPGYQPAYRFLAEALLGAGRGDEAAGPLRKVLEGEPDNQQARLALAQILSDRGDHAEAIEVLRGAPTPLDSVEARTRLATELYLVGDLDGAGNVLTSLAQDAPDNRYVQLLHGLVLSAQARNEEALATLEPLLDGGPSDAELAVTVSELLLREEREDEAVNVLRSTVDRLEKEGPSEQARRVRLALARLYANLGRWQTVEETVAPLLPGQEPPPDGDAEGDETGPADDSGAAFEARLLWADALAEQGRGEEALNGLPAAGPDTDPAILAKRVELLGRLGRVDEAVSILDSLADGNPDASLQAIEGLHRSGHFEETLEALRRVVSMHEDSVAGQFLLGAAEERAGHRDEAIETFQELLDDHPDFHPALNYLGYMWVEKNENLDEAISMIRHAVRLDPGNGAYVDSLGWALYQKGDLESARDTLERASRLAQDPTIYEHLGDVYVALGDVTSARRAYNRAMELEADDPDTVARKLSELETPADGEPAAPIEQR